MQKTEATSAQLATCSSLPPLFWRYYHETDLFTWGNTLNDRANDDVRSQPIPKLFELEVNQNLFQLLRWHCRDAAEQGTDVDLIVDLTTPDQGVRKVQFNGTSAMELPFPSDKIGVVRDITHEHCIVHENQQLASEVSKYRSLLQEFSYMAQHQLRAPVANIKALNELMQQHDGIPKEILAALSYSIDLLDLTSREVSEAARMHLGPCEPFESVYLRDVVLHVKVRVEELRSQHNAIIHSDAVHNVRLWYPRRYLEHCLYELVLNALQFTHPLRQQIIEISSEIAGTSLVLQVSDRGNGFDATQFGSRTFIYGGRFHAHASRRGTGLYAVRTMVESLGGRYSIHSKPDSGTVVQIVLTDALTLHRDVA